MKGSHNFIWGFLYELKKFYNKNSQHQNINKKNNTNNDSNTIKTLEKSLLYWLGTLGVFSNDKPWPKYLKQIEEQFKNGTILCDIIEITEGKKTYCHRNPKINGSKLSNINKALTILRQNTKISTKYLWKEKEILNGNMNIIIGLLEDIHKAFDGAPKNNNKHYLGDLTKSKIIFTEQQQYVPPNKSKEQQKKIFDKKIEIKNFNYQFLPGTPPTELKPNIPTPSNNQNIFSHRPYPEPFLPSSHLSNVLLPPPSHFQEL